MKQLKKSHMLAAAAITLGVATAGAGVIHAASTNATGTGPMNGLVAAIAQKFNLNQNDVQQVFDQQKVQMQAQHQATEKQRLADRLSQAVTAGKLTQSQADLITAKAAELETFKASLAGKTPAERQTAMKTEMDALKQWITDNKIPQQYMPFGFGHGPGMGRHHHGPNF